MLGGVSTLSLPYICLQFTRGLLRPSQEMARFTCVMHFGALESYWFCGLCGSTRNTLAEWLGYERVWAEGGTCSDSDRLELFVRGLVTLGLESRAVQGWVREGRGQRCTAQGSQSSPPHFAALLPPTSPSWRLPQSSPTLAPLLGLSVPLPYMSYLNVAFSTSVLALT